jgi:uncharacterized protein (TIGR00369 family)
MTATDDVPEGWKPLFRTSPFLDAIGPLHQRDTADGFIVGLRIRPKHANARGLAHGGVLMTLADIALGYRAAFSVEPPASLTTASVTTDFAGSARVGDWLEAHVEVHKVGGRLAFANAWLVVDGQRIARASAVFARNSGPRPEAAGQSVAGSVATEVAAR